MASKTSSAATAFAKALRSLETGGFTYSDVLAEMKVLLAAGASPTELREVLRGRELIEPLSQPAHAEVFGLLNDAIANEPDRDDIPPEAQNIHSDFAPDQTRDRVPALTAVPGPAGIPKSSRSTAVEQGGSALPIPALSPFPGARGPQLVSTQHLPSKVEAAAVERATALVAELAAARTALESEQKINRETAEALADRIASMEVARAGTEDALRESERHQADARLLRDTLSERDVQLAALTEEHAKIRQSLEARTKSGAQLEADLQATRASESALIENLVAARAALESEQSKTQEHYKALTSRIASTETALALTEEALRESERRHTEAHALHNSLAARDAQLAALTREHATVKAALEARSKGGAQLEADLQAARARAIALAADLAAARTQLESEQRKSQDNGDALTARIKSTEASLRRTEAALRESEKYKTESHRLRDTLDARNAEFVALQQNHAKIVSELEARKKSAAHSATELPPAPALVSPMSTPLKVGRESLRLGTWKPAPSPRILGISAAVILAAIAAWSFVHLSSAPPALTESAASSAAAQTPGASIRDCPACPAMTILPAGRFKQGSPRADGNPPVEMPQRWVSIRHPFAMSTNPVTVDEFGQFVSATGRDMQGCDTYDRTWKQQPGKDWKEPGFVQTGKHPVTCVSSHDAEAYASWLSTKTGYRYRLPSASEWEYGARAGGEAVQPWSPNGSGACANANVADQSAVRRYPGWQVFACDDGYVYTSPVGSFKANSFGLNDMLGNVFQWTRDCWHADYTGAPIDGSARTDGDCAVRELRGGSWFTSPAYVRANYRNHFPAEYRTSTVGIRLVRELAQ